jgi:hypothetical protein
VVEAISTHDADDRALLGRLVQATREGSVPVSDAIRQIVGQRRVNREHLVRLIETLVESDQELQIVSGSIRSLLRSSLAAESVRDSLAGDAAIEDQDDTMLTPDDVLRIARVQGEAQASVLRRDLVDAARFARSLGSKAENPREFARSVRMRGDVVAIPRAGGFLYPGFQIDIVRGALWPIVKEINHRLGAKDDPWGVASWWFTPDSRLGGEPAAFVGDPTKEPELRAAAARELAPLD